MKILQHPLVPATTVTQFSALPSLNHLNSYSIGGRIGSRGVPIYPLVKENFFEFNFNFSFGGMLYKERKYD